MVWNDDAECPPLSLQRVHDPLRSVIVQASGKLPAQESFLSLVPGKLTLAPFFLMLCYERKHDKALLLRRTQLYSALLVPCLPA